MLERGRGSKAGGEPGEIREDVTKVKMFYGALRRNSDPSLTLGLANRVKGRGKTKKSQSLRRSDPLELLEHTKEMAA